MNDGRPEAEALVDAGFDVEVIHMRENGAVARKTVNGVELTTLPGSVRKTSQLRYVFDYGFFFGLVAATLTARHLRRPYTVIQVNTMPDFLVFATALPKLLGARVVAYMHEPSPELAESLFGLNGADPGSLLGNWAPPDEEQSGRVFRVVCHGSIEDRNGQDTIVEAPGFSRTSSRTSRS